MAKKKSKLALSYIHDLKTLSELPKVKKYRALYVDQFPFDLELLSLSRLYRESRQQYLEIGGSYSAKVSSMMRSLSAQDLFKNDLNYSPAMNEMMWFKDHAHEVTDPEAHTKALQYFNENSLYHEQNHRIVWSLLPPAPKDRSAFRRYLNFSEALVVTLDLALGDEIGKRLSPVFERMNVIYRPAGHDSWSTKSKTLYRHYLLSLFTTTYFALELIHHDDILKALDYIFPGQKGLNKAAVARGLELSELFTMNTNPQWQSLNWQQAQKKLASLHKVRLRAQHKNRSEAPFWIAEDPLDLNIEFSIVRAVFSRFGL